jgi:integrase
VSVNPALRSGGRRKTADKISETERRQKIRPLTVDHLGRFVAAAFDRLSLRDATLLLTLADAGLRPGEGFGLHWADVDTANRTLNVERSISGGREKGTKTDEPRTVDHAPARRRARALAGHGGSRRTHGKSRLVALGIPVESRNSRRSVEGLETLQGTAPSYPRHRSLYDLRHTYASHLLADVAPSPTLPNKWATRRPPPHWRTTRTTCRAVTSDGPIDSASCGQRPTLAPKLGTKSVRWLRSLPKWLIRLEPGAGVEPATY